MLSNQLEIHNENEPINLTSSNGPEIRKKSVSDRRHVHFPEDDSIIISCLEPFHPTPDNCTSEELIAAYIASCKLYKTPAIDFLLEQLRGIDLSICNERYSRLCLRGIRLNRYQVETLEEVFRRVHFQDLDLEDTYLDEASAVALFDMMLHYETCVDLSISLSLEKSTSSMAWSRCITYLRKSGVLQRFKLSHTSLTAPLFNGLSLSGLSLTTLTFQDCALTGAPLQCLLRLLRYLMTYTASSVNPSSVGSGGSNASRYPRPSYRGPMAPVPWGLTLRLPGNRINALDAESLLLLVRHQLVMLPGPPTPSPSDSPTAAGVPTNRPAGGSGYLEELDLSHNLLRDEGVRVLCAGLNQAYQLQHRRLEVALKAIAEASGTAHQQRSLPPRSALPRACGLRRLVLADNGLTGDAGARHLAAVLSCATERLAPLLGGLSVLDLSDNPGLGDAGLVALCHGLIRNFTLKQLILRNVRMRFDGVFALSGYVGETRTLEQLDIRQNVVDVASVMALTRTLKVNRSLHSLLMDVRSSNLPPNEEFEIVRIFLKEMEDYLRRNRNSQNSEMVRPSSPETQVAEEATEEVLSPSIQTAVDQVPSPKMTDDLTDQVGEQAAVEIKEILLDPPRHPVARGESMLSHEEGEKKPESPKNISEENFAPMAGEATAPIESCVAHNAVSDSNVGDVSNDVEKPCTLEINGNGRTDGVTTAEVGADDTNLSDSLEIVSFSALEVSEDKHHDLTSYSIDEQSTVAFDKSDKHARKVESDSNSSGTSCPRVKDTPLAGEEDIQVESLKNTLPEVCEPSQEGRNNEGLSFPQDNEVNNFSLVGIEAEDSGVVSNVGGNASTSKDESSQDLGGENCSAADAQLLEPFQSIAECVSESKHRCQGNVKEEETIEAQKECKRVSERDFTIVGVEADTPKKSDSASDKGVDEDTRELRNRSDGHTTQEFGKSVATASDSRHPKSETLNHELSTKMTEKCGENLDGSEAEASINRTTYVGISGNDSRVVVNAVSDPALGVCETSGIGGGLEIHGMSKPYFEAMADDKGRTNEAKSESHYECWETMEVDQANVTVKHNLEVTDPEYSPKIDEASGVVKSDSPGDIERTDQTLELSAPSSATYPKNEDVVERKEWGSPLRANLQSEDFGPRFINEEDDGTPSSPKVTSSDLVREACVAIESQVNAPTTVGESEDEFPGLGDEPPMEFEQFLQEAGGLELAKEGGDARLDSYVSHSSAMPECVLGGFDDLEAIQAEITASGDVAKNEEPELKVGGNEVDREVSAHVDSVSNNERSLHAVSYENDPTERQMPSIPGSYFQANEFKQTEDYGPESDFLREAFSPSVESGHNRFGEMAQFQFTEVFRAKKPNGDDSNPNILASFYGTVQHSYPEATSDDDSCDAVSFGNITKVGPGGIAPFTEADLLHSHTEVGLESSAGEQGRDIESFQLEDKQSEEMSPNKVESEGDVKDNDLSALKQPDSNNQSSILSDVVRGSLEGISRGEDDRSSNHNFAQASVNEQLGKLISGLDDFADLHRTRLGGVNEAENRFENSRIFDPKSDWNALTSDDGNDATRGVLPDGGSGSIGGEERPEQESPNSAEETLESTVVVDATASKPTLLGESATKHIEQPNPDSPFINKSLKGKTELLDFDVMLTEKRAEDSVRTEAIVKPSTLENNGFGGFVTSSTSKTQKSDFNSPCDPQYVESVTSEHGGGSGSSGNSEMQTLETCSSRSGQDAVDVQSPPKHLEEANAIHFSLEDNCAEGLENVKEVEDAKIEVAEDQVLYTEHPISSQTDEKSNVDLIESGFMSGSLALKRESISNSKESLQPDAQEQCPADLPSLHETAEPGGKLSPIKSKRKSSPNRHGCAEEVVQQCPWSSDLRNKNEEEQDSSIPQLGRLSNPASSPRPWSSAEWKVDEWEDENAESPGSHSPSHMKTPLKESSDDWDEFGK